MPPSTTPDEDIIPPEPQGEWPAGMGWRFRRSMDEVFPADFAPTGLWDAGKFVTTAPVWFPIKLWQLSLNTLRFAAGETFQGIPWAWGKGIKITRDAIEDLHIKDALTATAQTGLMVPFGAMYHYGKALKDTLIPQRNAEGQLEASPAIRTVTEATKFAAETALVTPAKLAWETLMTATSPIRFGVRSAINLATRGMNLFGANIPKIEKRQSTLRKTVAERWGRFGAGFQNTSSALIDTGATLLSGIPAWVNSVATTGIPGRLTQFVTNMV